MSAWINLEFPGIFRALCVKTWVCIKSLSNDTKYSGVQKTTRANEPKCLQFQWLANFKNCNCAGSLWSQYYSPVAFEVKSVGLVQWDPKVSGVNSLQPRLRYIVWAIDHQVLEIHAESIFVLKVSHLRSCDKGRFLPTTRSLQPTDAQDLQKVFSRTNQQSHILNNRLNGR